MSTALIRRGECPSCDGPVTPSAEELAAKRTTCAACRAPLAVRAGDLPDAAFRGSTSLELAELETSPPHPAIRDRSTTQGLNVWLQLRDPAREPWQLALAQRMKLLMWPLVGIFGLVPWLAGTGWVWSLLWLPVTALFLFVLWIYIGSFQVERMTQIRSRTGGLEVLTFVPGKAPASDRLTEIDRVSVEPRTTDGAPAVVIGTKNGRKLELSPALPEDAAHWLARRIRRGLR